MRVFVVEPYEVMRDSLAEFVKMLGHEAVAATIPPDRQLAPFVNR